MSLISELQERRIWRVAVAYPSVTFVLLQAVEFFINNYGLDARTLTLTIVVAAVLFPAAVVWNWRHGEVGAQTFVRAEIAGYTLSAVVAVLAASWYWSVAPQPAAQREAALEPARSIAVMPFANAADNTDVQYLCDGIAESLINWLATIPEVHVVSKGPAFRLRDFADDTERLARELDVDGVIRGRLELVEGRIVVSAALVDTRDERQLWGERLVEPRTDIINVERSIVAAIKDSLRLTVSSSRGSHSAAGGTDNAQAYEAYLRGHFLIQSTNLETILDGLDELRVAIRLDPRFALPYADIADALSQVISYGLLEDDALVGEARNAAFTAIALAPELAEAHTALGTLHEYIDFDWEAADAAYRKAVSLQPQRPAPYHRFADFLILTRRAEEARQMAAAAISVDALDGSAMHAVGLAELASGNYAKAVEALDDWNRFHPNSRWSYVKHGLALAHNDQCEEATQQVLAAERLMNGAPAPLIDSWMAWSHRLCGNEDHYARSKARIEEHRAANPGLLHPAYAYLMALEGDVNALASFLEAIAAERNVFTPFIQVFASPKLKLGVADELAEDARYQALLARLDFPDGA